MTSAPDQPAGETAGAAAGATTGMEDAGGGGQASLWGDAWKDLRRNPLFIISALLIITFTVMAIWPSLFTNADPSFSDLSRTAEPPSNEAWFGFDVQGRDYFARTVYGARASIIIGVSVVLLAAAIAIVLGMVAGYFGGWIDAVISRIADIWFALPLVLGAMVVLAVIDRRTVWTVAFVLTLFAWPTMTRLMRSAVIANKDADYVNAARVLGASNVRIMVKHILPNALAPVIVYGTIMIGVMISAEAALSFLGIGLRPPSVSWGVAINGAQTRILQAPHLLAFPAAFLALTVLGFVMLGDALRDALDPKLR